MDQEQPQTDVSLPEATAAEPNSLPTAAEEQVAGGAASAPSKTAVRENDGWLATIQSLLVTVTIAVFVITFIVQAFEIPSQSMETTLLVGDYLLVDKTHYGSGGAWNWLMPYRKVKRGDIMVFHFPGDIRQHYVKRVIGLPGDRIRLRHKKVFVNGVPLVEPYAIYSDRNEDAFRDDFPNGNALQGGIDSKWYMELSRLKEDGQLIVPADHYFVMGDNRDDSSDSRYWGFVPKDNIVGRPLLIYFSLGSSTGTELGRERPDVKLSLRTILSRIAHDIRWRRVLRLVE